VPYQCICSWYWCCV